MPPSSLIYLRQRQTAFQALGSRRTRCNNVAYNVAPFPLSDIATLPRLAARFERLPEQTDDGEAVGVALGARDGDPLSERRR